MGIENERERTSSMLDCKHNVLHKPILLKMEKVMKENNEKKMKNCDEISKLIKAFPKDIAALDKRSVLAKVNSQGSGRQKPSPGQIPKVEEDNE